MALRYRRFAILFEKASTEKREETVAVIKIALKKKKKNTNQQALSLRYFLAYKNQKFPENETAGKYCSRNIKFV